MTTTRRDFLKRASFGVASLALPCYAFSKAGENVQQPNIIVVNIDDLGPAWLPPYARRLKPSDVEEVICQKYAKEKAAHGSFDLQKHLDAARTSMPYLDSLAREGAVFDWCFATASLCSPSRSALLTGQYQQRWGSYSLPDVSAIGIPKNVPCLVETFKQAGYDCGIIGKWHVGIRDPAIREQAEAKVKSADKGKPAKHNTIAEVADSLGYDTSCAPGYHPLDRGFAYYFGYNKHASKYYEADDLWENHQRVEKRPSGEFLTDLFNAKANQFVSQTLQSGHRFFLYYAPMTVHGMLLPPPEKYSAQFHTGIKNTDDFAGHLRALDEGIRGIFDLLKSHHQDQNTLFILTADNGPASAIPPYNAPLHGGKGTGWLGGSHVPLIINWPGHIHSMVREELVSHLDILPTALDAAGLKPPQPVDGQTLLPLLRGEAVPSPHERLFSAGLHAGNWSYPYFETNKNKRDEGTCPMYLWGLSKTSLLMFISPTHPGVYNAFPQGRPAQTLFFDIRHDPQQKNNLYAPGPDVKKAATAIATWLRTTIPPAAIHQSDYHELRQMGDAISH